MPRRLELRDLDAGRSIWTGSANHVTDEAVVDPSEDPVAEQVAEARGLPALSMRLCQASRHRVRQSALATCCDRPPRWRVTLASELGELSGPPAAPALRAAAARRARGRARPHSLLRSQWQTTSQRSAELVVARGAFAMDSPSCGAEGVDGRAERPPRRRRAAPSPGRLRAPRSEALYRLSVLPLHLLRSRG